VFDARRALTARNGAADTRAMESATLTLTPDTSIVADHVAAYGPVGPYLLTINPFVNFKRWALAQLAYWAMCWTIVALAMVPGFLAA
jgi:hypothetical protein